MKIGRFALALLLVSVLLFTIVSAIDTPINIKTFPKARASILIIENSEEYQLLQSFNEDVPETGELQVIYSGEATTFKINVQISMNGERILLEKFGVKTAGSPLYFQVIPGHVSDNYLSIQQNITNITGNETNPPPVNNTNITIAATNTEEESTTELEEQEQNSEDSITGSAVSESLGFSFSKTTYLIIGGIFVALAIFFIVAKTTFLKKDPAYSYRPIKPEMYEHKIEDAEKKIQEVRSALNQFKSRSKIDELERKIAEDKKTLEKLKSGKTD